MNAFSVIKEQIPSPIMKLRYFAFFQFILLVSFLLTLSSCLPEKKLAMQFAENPQGINLLVFSPDYIYKYNHKGEEIPGFDTLRSSRQDSALWVNSRYMQFLSDSVLLENYMNGFVGELRKLGFIVYLPSSIDSFLTDKPQSYIVNLAQIQMDEYTYPLEDEQPFEDTVYYKRFDLNAMDFSCWFELSKVNAAASKKTMLYSSHSAYDDFEGSFMVDPWTRNVRYRYRIDSLSVTDIYDMATFLGKKHASYLFDYFLNQYVAASLPESEPLYYYYHYNRPRHSVAPVEEDRFDVLGTKD